ncbi:2-hydroxy-3-oxopropionate reductase [Thalassobaculum fulvum]|uniref:2-hydroxy-3-oxopropionate reductase n=1 Tax=Thalassobaculum fulvum TaxID=1633335 RepID=A0A918XWM0_9PROT|nr:NAD(P)-dependent oxidoreductase [Thalassobaculum fulvum]GHD59303.1 2-hydroxy-3-oxopropionate reductase [Thalassobaculum fulvum]
MTAGADPNGVLAGRRVGFVGLGLMGVPMVRRLAAAGAELALWTRSIEKAEALASELPGAAAMPSPRHVAEVADTVIVMVTDADAVEAVVFDPYEDEWGIAHGLSEDGLVVDMGTTAVDRTRDFAGRIRMIGGSWVDAPVSGGTTAAEAGTLTVMAGGSDPDFARAEPLFRAMGQRITHVGPVGAGQIAKTANQMIVGLTIGAVAEALALSKRAGVDPARVREAIFGGFAHSRILELHGERMVTGDFQPRARVTIQRKDMRAARDLAEQVGLALPGLAANLPLWEALAEAGRGDLDHSALVLAIDPEEWDDA